MAEMRAGQDGAAVPTAAAAHADGAANGQEQPLLVGRLRRWHKRGEWGFIFSELHNCDVFLDGQQVVSDGPVALREGDFMFFQLAVDEGGNYARTARRAEGSEVERQQELLAPVYQQHAARAPRVAELPRSTASSQREGRSTSSSVSAAGPPARDGPLLPPLTQPSLAAAVHGTAGSPSAAGGQRRAPPPPPPPSHPAPTGPAAFGAQGLGPAVGLLPHQQPYVAHQAYGGYATYTPNDRAFGIYQQGPWPTSESVLAVGGLGTSAVGQPQAQQPLAPGQPPQPGQAPQQPPQQQLPSANLLLDPPQALERPDPKATVLLLKGSGGLVRRAQTFRSTRSGPAAQLGLEWCQILRQACSAGQEHGDVADGHHAQPAGGWGDAAQWDLLWGTGAAAMEGHAAHGGDAYSNANSLAGPLVSPTMLGIHGGDQGLYATNAAGG